MKHKSSKSTESSVWDPGCLPDVYNNNNNTYIVVCREDMNNTKLITRISPQRSIDSGYCDSSDSVPSSLVTIPHITTVYISPCPSDHNTSNTRHTDTHNNNTREHLEEIHGKKSSDTTNTTTMNCITVLLEEFRKEEISFDRDQHEPTQSIISNPFAMSSSISLPSSSSMSMSFLTSSFYDESTWE